MGFTCDGTALPISLRYDMAANTRFRSVYGDHLPQEGETRQFATIGLPAVFAIGTDIHRSRNIIHIFNPYGNLVYYENTHNYNTHVYTVMCS